MKKQKLGNSELMVSNIGLGCMRLSDKTHEEAVDILKTAIAQGINFFDHADIYGRGLSEEIFGKAIKETGIEREDIIIQSKVGIRPEMGLYDFSFDHIISATENILKRLDTDYLDILLLHRPDTLMDPFEVSRAFMHLHRQGKVKNFGISNCNPYQVELIQSELPVPLITNQIQFSLMHTLIIDEGINVNMNIEPAIVKSQGILEYSRLNNITLQAWSPFQYGFFEGTFIDNEKFPTLNTELQKLATKYSVSKTTIAAAWILRHPAKIQVIAGSMNVNRIKEITEASELEITHAEWYDLYKAAGNQLP